MRQNDEPSEAVSDSVPDHTRAQTAPLVQEPEDLTELVPSSDDPMGTRIIYVVVAMVVLMFIIALFFLFEVARHRPA